MENHQEDVNISELLDEDLLIDADISPTTQNCYNVCTFTYVYLSFPNEKLYWYSFVLGVLSAAALRRLREKISSHARGSKGRSTSDSVSTNARAAKRKVIAEAADPFPMIDPHVPVECAYIPSWSVKTTTSLLGVEAPEIAQWARYAVTPIDRISSEEASLEVCASRLNHAHYLVIFFSHMFVLVFMIVNPYSCVVSS